LVSNHSFAEISFPFEPTSFAFLLETGWATGSEARFLDGKEEGAGESRAGSGLSIRQRYGSCFLTSAKKASMSSGKIRYEPERSGLFLWDPETAIE
jgi:hypothetical protein